MSHGIFYRKMVQVEEQKDLDERERERKFANRTHKTGLNMEKTQASRGSER